MKTDSEKVKVEISTNSEASIIVYVRNNDIPSQTYYNALYQGSDLTFYVGTNFDGNYIAIFNPDLDNTISKFSFNI